MNGVNVSTIIPKEWENAFENYCKSRERSKSYVLRKALENILFGEKNLEQNIEDNDNMLKMSQESFQEWNSKEDDEQFGYLKNLIK